MFESLKTIHVISVAISGLFFAIRGGVMLFSPSFTEKKWVRRLAESIDTVLLFSGIGLAWMTGQMPWEEAWLGVKLLLLLLYIFLGMLAFHWLHHLRLKGAAWIVALLTFALMLSVAWTRSPWPMSG